MVLSLSCNYGFSAQYFANTYQPKILPSTYYDYKLARLLTFYNFSAKAKRSLKPVDMHEPIRMTIFLMEHQHLLTP